MTWNVPLKAALLFSVAISVSPALAHDQAKNPHPVAWHGLCIPETQDADYPKPGNHNLDVFSHWYIGKTHGDWLGLFFPLDEITTAIPGWNPDTPYSDLTQGGLAVEFAADATVVKSNLPDYIQDLYALKGLYKDATVEELGQSGLFKVQNQSESASEVFQLLLTDPRKANKPSLVAWPYWYAGFCEDRSTLHLPNQCHVSYADQGIAIEFSLKGNDIMFVRQVDAFLSRKVHEWRTACHATK